MRAGTPRAARPDPRGRSCDRGQGIRGGHHEDPAGRSDGCAWRRGGQGAQVVTVGRTAGDIRADVADPEQTARVFAQVSDLDAVASAAGDVPYKRVVEMAPEDYLSAYHGKVASQIELVRQGTRQVAERGSFTLIAGVLSQEPIVTGSAAAMANGAVESFVRAAAIETRAMSPGPGRTSP